MGSEADITRQAQLVRFAPKLEPIRRKVRIGSPGRIRTSDPAVNSRLLYLLSYRGAERAYEAQLGRVIANAGMACQSFTGRHLRGPCG